MATVGADVTALFSFSSQLKERRRKIEQATQRLGALVRDANWVGPDRDRFVAEWSERYAPHLMAVCENLDANAKRAYNAAVKQQNASAR